jgi:MYXO-CTERM domain-containing protein
LPVDPIRAWRLFSVCGSVLVVIATAVSCAGTDAPPIEAQELDASTAARVEPATATTESVDARREGSARPEHPPVNPRPVDVAPPPMATTFDALDDNNTQIPPDIAGAVGPNHLVVALNPQLRMQNKTGTTLVTTTLATFFNSLGHTGTIDSPRVAYDSLAGRWILTAAADRNLSTSAVVVAASQTNDPTGSWWFYNIATSGTNYADWPLVGFNKDWIVITSNLFTNSGSTWQGCHVDVFNKATVYNGTATTWSRFTTTTASGHFGMQPALTYDGTLATMYLVETWSAASGQERIVTITGAIGSETLTSGPLVAMPQGAWSATGTATNFAPQLGSTNKIDTFDHRMGTVVYRNGQLWGTHTIFLPSTTPTRSSIQWFSLSGTGSVNQSGRIDDSTGTKFFAYPSLAVNQYNDVLVGYSSFSASQYASADYAVHVNFDAANTMRDDTVYKAGLAPYFRDGGTGDNRWGLYSSTAVDPEDDATMWTLQEYAASPSNTWGTWWGKLGPYCSTVTCAPLDQCHAVGVCSPTTGTCSNPNAGNGTGCNDGNGCTTSDVCTNGTCGGSAITCTAMDQCHVAGVCNTVNGTCSNPNANNGTGCDDGNGCTTSDLCTNGTCGGNAYTCTPTECQASSTCNGVGGCTTAPKANGTACSIGACSGGVCTPVDAGAGDAGSDASADAATGADASADAATDAGADAGADAAADAGPDAAVDAAADAAIDASADSGAPSDSGVDASTSDSGGVADSGPMPDAAIAADASSPIDAADDGSGDNAGSGDNSGCGCRVVQTRTTPLAGWLGVGALALLAAARVRRRRSDSSTRVPLSSPDG